MLASCKQNCIQIGRKLPLQQRYHRPSKGLQIQAQFEQIGLVVLHLIVCRAVVVIVVVLQGREKREQKGNADPGPGTDPPVIGIPGIHPKGCGCGRWGQFILVMTDYR